MTAAPAHDEIMAYLQVQAQAEYAAFSARLIPDCPPMLGVRLPVLRRYAKALARHPPAAVLPALTDATFEERMLHGMVLSYADLPPDERRPLLERWLPQADNWSLCDSTAAGCRFLRAAPEDWLAWLNALARRDGEFPARFGLVCLLDHFSDTPQNRRMLLRACAEAPCRKPYARLAAAWAVSTAAVKEPELGLAFLRQGVLDAPTQNMAIRKICESRRPAPEYRAAVKALRL